MTDIKRRPLSHSAFRKYMDCPKMYDFHYNERLRPTTIGSSLIIGCAWDDAINCLLEELVDPIEAFKAGFSDLTNVKWERDDYDGELLTVEDRNSLLLIAHDKGYNGDDIDSLASSLLRKPLHEQSDNQKEVLGEMCKATWIRKAELLLEEYNKVVMPLIEEVECVQKEIKIGDRIMGIADFVATVKGHGRVLLDNKTSKRPYDEDSVKSDAQLALYSAALGADKAGFIIAHKVIKKNRIRKCIKCSYDRNHNMAKSCQNEIMGKRCKGDLKDTINPQAQIQIIIDDVPEVNKEMIISSMTQVNQAIDHKIFPRNTGSCKFMYGRRCPYYNKCWGGDNNGLETKE